MVLLVVEFVDRAVAVHENLFRLHAVHFGAKSAARAALGTHVGLTVREGIGSAWHAFFYAVSTAKNQSLLRASLHA